MVGIEAVFAQMQLDGFPVGEAQLEKFLQNGVVFIEHFPVELAQEANLHTVSAEALTEDMFCRYLDSAGVPDPELVIRPSGELRTSNFLPWQTVYSEFVYMNVLWPDFGPSDLDAAIEEYNQRNRRFGGV